MRSRFLLRIAALRAAISLREARGKAPVNLASGVRISKRFSARLSQRDRPETAPEEEARAHDFEVFAVFVVPKLVAIYVVMYNIVVVIVIGS